MSDTKAGFIIYECGDRTSIDALCEVAANVLRELIGQTKNQLEVGVVVGLIQHLRMVMADEAGIPSSDMMLGEITAVKIANDPLTDHEVTERVPKAIGDA